MRRRHKKNRRLWKGGYQTYVEVNGASRSKSWPLNTSDEDMDQWVADQKRDTIKGPARGTFAADATEFLTRIAATHTYRQLAACVTRWVTALGADRPRRTIKAAEIDATLQAWERDGMGPASLQKHRMILMAMWNRLDGKDAPNPVRATRRPQLPKPEARSLPYPTIAKIIAAMADRTAKQRQMKRRVRVIAFTGIPPGMLGTVTPADLNLTAKTVRLHPRRKGRGVEARTMPLIPAGVSAFREFHVANDYGAFREDLTNREFRKAAKSLGIHGVTVYDLRHSFATELYRAVKDLDTVARFLQHSTITLTQRYAKAAMGDVDRAAARTLGRSLSREPVPNRKSSMKPRKQ